MLPMLTKIASCLPTHTRRSEDSQALQQFSTPIPLGWPHAPRLALRRPIAFLSLLLGPVCSPSLPSSPAAFWS
jgi:hypothetical protein